MRQGAAIAALALSLVACTSTAPDAGSRSPTPSAVSRVGLLQLRPVIRTLAPSSAEWNASPPTCSGADAAVCIAQHEGDRVILATEDGTSRFELDPAVLDERDVATASAETDESSGRWLIAIHLTPSGTESLSRSTADHLHGKLASVVGGVVVSVPIVESRISSGQVALVAGDHAAAVALADALGGTSS